MCPLLTVADMSGLAVLCELLHFHTHEMILCYSHNLCLNAALLVFVHMVS